MATTKKIPLQIRQGDVLLVAVDHIPDGATAQPADPERGIVLAEGEVTGHAHRIPHRHAGGAKAYRTETDAQFLRATAPVPLRHEEHKTRCATCTAWTIATHRAADQYGAAAYTCAEHAPPTAVPLAEHGATILPPRADLQRLPQVEYRRGAVPRRVED
jgi:hypothetical protein